MKKFLEIIIFLLFVALCYDTTLAKPIDESPPVFVINSQHERFEDGYRFSYTLSDGQTRYESAYYKKDIEGNDVLVINGDYSYIGDDGQTYRVNYVADENGFRVIDQPAHLPPNIIASLAG